MKPEPPKNTETHDVQRMRKNKAGECVSKEQSRVKTPTPLPGGQPQVKTPTPTQAPLRGKTNKETHRCPKGMRKNKDGECVPKDGNKATSPPEEQPQVKTPTPTQAPLRRKNKQRNAWMSKRYA